jgi:primosomal protein N' (replication factor Y)
MEALDYRVEEAETVPPIGTWVKVPFRQQQRLGVVWSHEAPSVDAQKIRPILSVLERAPPMDETMRSFVAQCAHYTVASLGSVMKMVVPGAVQAALMMMEEGRKSRRSSGLPDPLAPPIRPHRLSSEGLSAEQMAVFGVLSESMLGTPPGIALLDGVTGSGKTEVYTAVLGSLLDKDPEVQGLILLPEIGLTPQIIARVEARLGAKVGVWHSDCSPAQRRDTAMGVMLGDVRVVIGARSALFLPFRRLRLIVLDEEHDASYKQEEGVRYHAREMALLRSHKRGVGVILASATPSLETMYQCEQGRVTRWVLPSRYGEAVLPSVSLIPVRRAQSANLSDPKGVLGDDSLTVKPGQWVTAPLRQAMAETVAGGEQVLVFLNRRGYAPLTLCKACDYRLSCRRCSSWLSLHRRTTKASGVETSWMVCHHCAERMPLPETCPDCMTPTPWIHCGPGVDRIAEEIREAYPDWRVAVLSRDHCTTPKQWEAALAEIRAQTVDVIVATQILAKGHHFPGIRCVGVIEADSALHDGNFRGTETAYQLLHQVAGRAGRAGGSSRVLLQVYDTTHPMMQCLVENDRDKLYTIELEHRRRAGLPPYGQLACITAVGKKEGMLQHYLKHLAASFRPWPAGVVVTGPVPASMALLRGQWRHRLWIQAPKSFAMARWIRHGWLAPPSGVETIVDCFPYDFL